VNQLIHLYTLYQFPYVSGFQKPDTYGKEIFIEKT